MHVDDKQQLTLVSMKKNNNKSIHPF